VVVRFNLEVHVYMASHLGERSGDGSGRAPITQRLTLKAPLAAIPDVYSHFCGAYMMESSSTQLRARTVFETLPSDCLGATLRLKVTIVLEPRNDIIAALIRFIQATKV
jgi:hypothetical protein